MKKTLILLAAIVVLGAGCVQPTPVPMAKPVTPIAPPSGAQVQPQPAKGKVDMNKEDLDNLKTKINTIQPTNLNAPK